MGFAKPLQTRKSNLILHSFSLLVIFSYWRHVGFTQSLLVVQSGFRVKGEAESMTIALSGVFAE